MTSVYNFVTPQIKQHEFLSFEFVEQPMRIVDVTLPNTSDLAETVGFQ